MADDLSQGEEWLDYSSSCFQNHGELFEPANEELQTETPKVHADRDTTVFSKLENVRELLKQSVSVDTHVRQKLTSPQCSPSSSPFNESCKHWIWVKLISNLNAVCQPKWHGSCLEECYCRSLQISKDLFQRKACGKNTIANLRLRVLNYPYRGCAQQLVCSQVRKNKRDQPQVAFDNSCQDFFNFHGVLSTNKEFNGTQELNRRDLYDELVNKNEVKYNDSTKSLDLVEAVKDTFAGPLDATFEDFDGELEWSDNDVKDDASLSNASLSSSGVNESEATAELSRLPYEEILRLRDELKQYTKQYSDILVVELEQRDAYIREKELKNDFISSFLSVQEKIRENTAATNKKRFSLQSNARPNTPPNSQSLTTIPYEIKNGGPSIDILEKLIEIMDAMRTNSPNVPTLLTDYILKVLCK